MTATQAPTPGPLDSESVKLLVKGDLLLCTDRIIRSVEQVDAERGVLWFTDGEACGPSVCVFIGRPDESGWMPWSGGEPTITDPTVDIEVRLRNGELHVDRSPAFDWTYDPEPHPFDIIAFRLAPTAPVEASGSEREEDALEALNWIENVFPGQGDTNDQGVTVRGWHRLDQACATIRAALSRPQPSGETREAVLKGVGKVNGDGWKDTTTKGETVFVWNAEKPAPYAPGQYPRVGNEGWSASTSQYDFTPATADDVPAILALLSARPLASGGQHSSGEAAGCAESEVGRAVYERIEKLIDAKPGTPEGDELSFLAFLVESVEEVGGYDGPSASTPARAEALDEGVAGELVKELRLAACGLFTLENETGDYGYFDNIADRVEALARAHPSPTPAADADRVLSVTDDEVSVLLEVLAYAGDEVDNATAASSLFVKAEALASLQSTAAKEGGEG